MDWKPSAAWPFRPGGSAEPHAMQLPASVRQVIDPTNWDNTATIPIDVAAGVLLRQYIPEIANFIQAQRQRYSLGSVEYHRMRGTAPQMLVDYINNSGQEIITVTLLPTSSSSSQPSGSCVVTTLANQVFYATDPTKWQEFDPSPAPFNTQYNQISPPISDVVHGKFWITQDGTAPDGATIKLFFSPTSFSWKEIDLVPDPALNNYNAENDYWVTSGLTALSAGGPPWTLDGKTWVLDSLPEDTLENGLIYPAPLWKGLYLQPGNFAPGAPPAWPLCDINNVTVQTVPGPSGTYAIPQLTAGNNLLVGIFRIGSGLDSDTYVLGVSKDNITWTTFNQVGDIPSVTTNPGVDNNLPEDLNPVPTVGTPVLNFNSLAQITFVPGWKLFVFAGNTASPVSWNYFEGAFVRGSTPALVAPSAAVATELIANPVEIFTSSDGISWTKRFQAGYTNGTKKPQPFDGGAPYEVVNYSYTTTSLGTSPGPDFADFVPLSSGQFLVTAGVVDAGSNYFTWLATLTADRGVNGSPLTISGSFPGAITVTAPPGYVQVDNGGAPTFSPIYNSADISYTYTISVNDTTWIYPTPVNSGPPFPDNLPWLGGVNSSSMGVSGISAGWPPTTYPIIITP
jgi:hypothetical protein